MSQTDILQVASDFLLDTGDPLHLDASVPEMLETLAKMIPVFGAVGVLYNYDASPDNPQRFFPLPDTVLQLLSVHFFPRELEPAGVRWAQDTLDPAWRNRTGVPTRYTQELETTRMLRLHPSPTVAGAAGIPPFLGIPGALVPTNHLVTFMLVAPEVVDLAPWAEDLTAYLLAAWESTKEGLREDANMAQALQGLVSMLVSLIKDLYHEPGQELVRGAWEMPLWLDFTKAY